MNASETRAGECHPDQWVKKTRLFREWEETKKEILDHKWYESEKAGHDIGWERASVDWLVRFGRRATKRKS